MHYYLMNILSALTLDADIVDTWSFLAQVEVECVESDLTESRLHVHETAELVGDCDDH